MADTKRCPDCAEVIQAAAVKCRYCGAQLQPAAVEDPRVQGKAAAIQEGRIASAPPGPGKITAWTIVWGIALLAMVGLTLTASDDIVGLWIFFGILSAIFFLVPFCNDLATVAPSGRTTALRGAKAFFGSLARGQGRRAWACLSPLDRTEKPRVYPAFRDMPKPTGEVGFQTAGKFAKWWKNTAGVSSSIGGWHKRLKYHVIDVEEIGAGKAVAHVEVKISGYPAWTVLTVFIGLLIAVILILVLRKEQKFEVQKLLVERDGLWWMVNGELDDAEDRALIELLRKG